MSRTTISNSDDILDSRDIIARIEELESEQQGYLDAIENAKDNLEAFDPDNNPDGLNLPDLQSAVDDAARDFHDWEAENGDELDALRSIAKEGEDAAPDWEHGATLIRETYFTDYCIELVQDIGDLPKNIPGYLVIDWDRTADNLRVDYSEIEWDGVTYLVR